MESLGIKIVGNGGCLNQGLSYNAFLINGHFLAECPPDIMVSLSARQVDLDRIDTVYLSHLHGDHTFGLPFLIINKWVRDFDDAVPGPLTILGPKGIAAYTRDLTEAAFTTNHPCYGWLLNNATYLEIGPELRYDLDGLELTCFPLRHIVETHGFRLRHRDKPVFTYIADTRWGRAVESVLKEGAPTVLMDMNGGGGNIHASPEEVAEKGLPITGEATTYYGTHLGQEFVSPHSLIRCATPGLELALGY